jgi:hypothetical protein
MDWVINMGFIDTGVDVLIREYGTPSDFRWSSVYALNVAPGTVTLMQQYDIVDPGHRNMYGVAATREPATFLLDFHPDLRVNFKDFARLAQYYDQNEPSVDIAPLAFGDGIVDHTDLAVLTEYWLKEVLPVSLIAYWKLDETGGEIAHDSVRGHDALLAGPLWQPTGGKLNGALQFDGINDYVSTDFVLNPGDGAFSVFAWVKGGGPGQVVMAQTEGGVNWLSADPSEGALMTELGSRARVGSCLFSQAVVIDGQWHRVGLAWDGAARILYVDDIEVARGTESLAASTGGLCFGAGKNHGPGRFWFGMIDDIRIYNRAVSP